MNRHRLAVRDLAAGAGLSLGAAFGLTATAQATDYTVDRTDDPAGPGACVLATPNDCSLRQAINDAQSAPNSPTVDRVLFQSGMSGTITLVFAGLFVSDPLDIVGPGANVLAVSGGDIQRVLDTEQANPGDPLTVSGLTLTHGYGSGSVGGGGIYSKDTYLKLISSTVSDSDSGISDYPGGGIRQKNGSLLIRNSTISGNEGGNGGGVYASNAAIGVENSTISGNTATGTGGGSGYGYGGGIWLDKGSGGSLISYSSTISGNHAQYGGGISANQGTAGGIVDTVIANNTATSDLDLRNAGPDPFKLAFSSVESTAGASIVDISTFPGSNVLGVDPQLGPLADNGGPTQTLKPGLGSPLLDKGLTTGFTADQRGLPRPFDAPDIANAASGDGADIGAVELHAADFVKPPPPTSAPAAPKKKCKKKHKRSAQVSKKKCKGKKHAGRR